MTQRVTGVQRVGREVLFALDALLADEPAGHAASLPTVLAPADARPPTDLKRISIALVGSRTGHVWEQVDLPRYARNGILLNLCNTAPAFLKNQVVLIHDAAVFEVPYAYTIAFRSWYRVLLRILARRASVLLTVSRFSQRALARSLAVDEDRFRVVTEGSEHIQRFPADTTVLERFGLRQFRYILAVSSANPAKNFDLIVRAATELVDLGHQLVVAGGTDTRVFNTETASRSAKLTRVGYVTDAQLRALYENAACFVYPSLYEGFGLPPIEAMSCGCPVIVSSAASLPEVCGDAALYCDPHSTHELIDRVRNLLADRALADTLRAKAREHARQYTWERSAEQIWGEVIRLRDGQRGAHA